MNKGRITRFNMENAFVIYFALKRIEALTARSLGKPPFSPAYSIMFEPATAGNDKSLMINRYKYE